MINKTDHWGNVRVVLNNGKSVVETNDYYPFGTPIYRDDGSTNSQKYKFNGKEFDEMHGLSSLDYGARQYNPALPLWDRVDPLCEKYYSISPYAYCAGNPVKFIDKEGKEPTPKEAALMSLHVYGDNNVRLTGEWKDLYNYYEQLAYSHEWF